MSAGGGEGYFYRCVYLFIGRGLIGAMAGRTASCFALRSAAVSSAVHEIARVQRQFRKLFLSQSKRATT